MPLEYNMDGLHALNFTKGCYVGQELIARAHYQGTVRKRMMPAAVEALDSALPAPGAVLTASAVSASGEQASHFQAYCPLYVSTD